MPLKKNLFLYFVKHNILDIGHKNAPQQLEARIIKKLVRDQIIKERLVNGLSTMNLKHGYILMVIFYSGLSRL